MNYSLKTLQRLLTVRGFLSVLLGVTASSANTFDPKSVALTGTQSPTLLSLKYQRRWTPQQRRKAKTYSDSEEIGLIRNKYRNKLYVFIAPAVPDVGISMGPEAVVEEN
jgi:hypothetical protein